jgi:hypothetical protein
MKVQVMVPVNVEVILRCERGGNRFVVLGHGQDIENITIFADDDLKYTYLRDLVKAYREESGCSADGLFGGNIDFDKTKKTIRLFGKSSTYEGMTPQLQKNVISAVGMAYPEFEVTCEL